MKRKSIIYLTLMLLVLTLFTSCYAKPTFFPLAQYSANVAKVELLKFRTDDHNSPIVIRALDPELNERFAQEFLRIPCYSYERNSKQDISAFDIAIRFTYVDGTYELVYQDMHKLYTHAGNRIIRGSYNCYKFDSDDFYGFLRKYFPVNK